MSALPPDDALLKTLKKLLPEDLQVLKANSHIEHISPKRIRDKLFWVYEGREVLPTELLGICAMVEEKLSEEQTYTYAIELDTITMDTNPRYFDKLPNLRWYSTHAPWQYRTLAAAKVFNVEVV